MTSGTTLDAHVRGYAQAVRLHLADLGPDVVDDLAGGLEADLAEAVADRMPTAAGGTDDDVVLDLVKVFGPAERYAAELRAAAGLPQAAPRTRIGLRARAAARGRKVRDAWSRAWAPLTSTPAWASFREALGELRPVWWVVRGWVLGALAAYFVNGWSDFVAVPTRTDQLVLMVAGAVVSVQWGRGRWMPWRWSPRLVTATTVAAAVLVLPLWSATRAQVAQGEHAVTAGSYDRGWQDGYESRQVGYGGAAAGADDGVWVDGMQVSNLFVYDANGDPLRDVQVFDDRGRPVRTVPTGREEETWHVPDVEEPWYFRPAEATDGRERWNVYPLRAFGERDMTYDEAGDGLRPTVGARPQPTPWPFLKAPTAIAPSERSAGADPQEPHGPQDPAAEGEVQSPAPSEPAGDGATTEQSGVPAAPGPVAPTAVAAP
ncbi:hypothetical protein DNL40_04990 [Xylanimonas oleitrophica]|uniref:Uncharacterized protein n=1 Tax=Xylanimonas oleitrophica TaxID=2607479 RepID=A0A2W5WT12_9MICO|nr:hypothetical protein [Xylanimonas oleitrophica]PZR54270.1 hypothetical protein DNL40_04990 [Xylanimonas oleitrophica]